MDNKQAIEEIKQWTPTLLSLGETCTNHTMEAQLKAIASLECIDEIIELIKDSSDKQYRNNNHWIYIGDKKGLADVLDIINKHLGE